MKLRVLALDVNGMIGVDTRFDDDLAAARAGERRSPHEENLKRLVGCILSQALDRDRPLWEMWLVEGLERDRFALLIKVHHCMMDGGSGASLLTRLFRADADPSIPATTAWLPGETPSPVRLVLDEAIDRASTPRALARAAADALRASGPTLRRARARAASVSRATHRLYVPSATVLERPIRPHHELRGAAGRWSR